MENEFQSTLDEFQSTLDNIKNLISITAESTVSLSNLINSQTRLLSTVAEMLDDINKENMENSLTQTSSILKIMEYLQYTRNNNYFEKHIEDCKKIITQRKDDLENYK